MVPLRVLSGTGNSLAANLEMIRPRREVSSARKPSDGARWTAPPGQAGTYTIMVSDNDNKFSGAYRVWAQRLNDPVGCAALSYTAPTSATMAAGAVGCYRLTVAAGDVVRLRVLSGTGNSLAANLEMIDPRGKSRLRGNHRTERAGLHRRASRHLHDHGQRQRQQVQRAIRGGSVQEALLACTLVELPEALAASRRRVKTDPAGSIFRRR